MLFSFTAFDNSKELEQYKAAAKQELEAYAEDKGQENYCAENWEVIMGLVVECKDAINAATDKAGVDDAVTLAKQKIDEVEKVGGGFTTCKKRMIKNIFQGMI